MTKITILDGGMGRELERMGAPFRQPEWSALALMESPHTVTQAHQAFVDAGAKVITTNAYALVPFHIGEERFAQSGREWIRLSATIAREVADKADDVKVAGCIPPLFGSYAPEDFDVARAPDILKPLIEEQNDHVDLWLIETTSAIEEARVAVDHLKSTGKPVWVAFTISERSNDISAPVTNRAGEMVSDCAKAVMDMGAVEAILFNCSHPEEFEDAIKETKNVVGDAIQIGAYANTFVEEHDDDLANEIVSELRDDLPPDVYLKFAKHWTDQGATIIGGCCGISPAHIRALSENL